MDIKVEKLPNGTNNLLITDDEGSGQYRIPLQANPSTGPSDNAIPTAAILREVATLPLAADSAGISAEADLMSLDINLAVGTSGKILLLFDCTFLSGNAGTFGIFRFKVDAAAKRQHASNLAYSNGVYVAFAMHEIVSGLSAGAHTIKVRAAANATALTVLANGGAEPTAGTALSIIEL